MHTRFVHEFYLSVRVLLFVVVACLLSSAPLVYEFADAAPAPVIEFTADPPYIETPGERVALIWNVTPRDSFSRCDALDGFTVDSVRARSNPGGRYVNQRGTKQYTIQCFNKQNKSLGVVSVRVEFRETKADVDLPVIVQFRANINEIAALWQPVALVWETINADQCMAITEYATASGQFRKTSASDWRGQKSPVQREPFTIRPRQNQTRYFLECENSRGKVQSSPVTINLLSSPPPVVRASIRSFFLSESNLFWTTENANECLLSERSLEPTANEAQQEWTTAEKVAVVDGRKSIDLSVWKQYKLECYNKEAPVGGTNIERMIDVKIKPVVKHFGFQDPIGNMSVIEGTYSYRASALYRIFYDAEYATHCVTEAFVKVGSKWVKLTQSPWADKEASTARIRPVNTAETTRYYLTCVDAKGRSSDPQFVQINIRSPENIGVEYTAPVRNIDSFQQSSVSPGLLIWNVDADICTLRVRTLGSAGIGEWDTIRNDFSAHNERGINPAIARDYLLECVRLGDPVSSRGEKTLRIGAPEITEFYFQTSSGYKKTLGLVQPGETGTLHSKTRFSDTCAVTARIYRYQGNAEIDTAKPDFSWAAAPLNSWRKLSVPDQGDVQDVTIPSTVRYEITCTNSLLSPAISATKRIEFDTGGSIFPITITSFTRNRDQSDPMLMRFSWESNADFCRFKKEWRDPSNPSPYSLSLAAKDGFSIRQIDERETYSVRCFRIANEKDYSEERKINIDSYPPLITTFTAREENGMEKQGEIEGQVGKTLTLYWDTTNATSCQSLATAVNKDGVEVSYPHYERHPWYRIDRAREVRGSQLLRIVEPEVYTLRCFNAAGEVHERKIVLKTRNNAFVPPIIETLREKEQFIGSDGFAYARIVWNTTTPSPDVSNYYADECRVFSIVGGVPQQPSRYTEIPERREVLIKLEGEQTSFLLECYRLYDRNIRAEKSVTIIRTNPYGSGRGLRGKYYEGEQFQTLAHVRVDAGVNFDWKKDAPLFDFPSDYFSARWEGFVNPRTTGEYTFTTISDDGVRLWINSQADAEIPAASLPLIDDWRIRGTALREGKVRLERGKEYALRLEYFDAKGNANIRLLWQGPGLALAPIPASQLYPAHIENLVRDGSGAGLTPDFFEDTQLTTLVNRGITGRRSVFFNWENGSPGNISIIPRDKFSVRWEGFVEPRYTGEYTFHTRSDDGVRLWIHQTPDTELPANAAPLIENWTVHPLGWNSGKVQLEKGKKYALRLEYFDEKGGARIELHWSSDKQPKEIVPASQLYDKARQSYVVSGSGRGLLGRYYDDSTFSEYVFRRFERVDHAWGRSSPDSTQFTDNDTFSARWEGFVQPRSTGEYTFHTFSDDGVRLWVSEMPGTDIAPTLPPLIDDLRARSFGSSPWRRGKVRLEQGKKYALRLEYFDNRLDAFMKLYWSSDNQPKEIVPSSQLYTPSEFRSVGCRNRGAENVFGQSTAPVIIVGVVPQQDEQPQGPNDFRPLCHGSGTGLRGDYFEDENFSDLLYRRLNETLPVSPMNFLVPGDRKRFFVRWSGRIEPEYSGQYTFILKGKGMTRLWIAEDADRDIDRVKDLTVFSLDIDRGTRTLTAGRHYAIQIEVDASAGDPSPQLFWFHDRMVRQPVPQSQLDPDPVPTPFAAGSGTGLLASYYHDKNFSQFAMKRREPSPISFDWRKGSPDDQWIKADDFSIRYEGEIEPEYSGSTAFHVFADDGVRLWVDGQLIIDDWKSHPAQWSRGTRLLTAGKRVPIKLEYFENKGSAQVTLWWSSAHQRKEIVPRDFLYEPRKIPLAAPSVGIDGGTCTPLPALSLPPYLEQYLPDRPQCAEDILDLLKERADLLNVVQLKNLYFIATATLATAFDYHDKEQPIDDSCGKADEKGVEAGFRETGEIRCGNIIWKLKPEDARKIVNPLRYFKKYAQYYQFLKRTTKMPPFRIGENAARALVRVDTDHIIFSSDISSDDDYIIIHQKPCEGQHYCPADFQKRIAEGLADAVSEFSPDLVQRVRSELFFSKLFPELSRMQDQPLSTELLGEIGRLFLGDFMVTNLFWDDSVVLGLADLVGPVHYLSFLASQGKVERFYTELGCARKRIDELSVAGITQDRIDTLAANNACSESFATLESYRYWNALDSALTKYKKDGGTFYSLMRETKGGEGIDELPFRKNVFVATVFEIFELGRIGEEVDTQAFIQKLIDFYREFDFVRLCPVGCSHWIESVEAAWKGKFISALGGLVLLSFPDIITIDHHTDTEFGQKANLFAAIASAVSGKNLTPLFQELLWPLSVQTQVKVQDFLAEKQSISRSFLEPLLNQDLYSTWVPWSGVQSGSQNTIPPWMKKITRKAGSIDIKLQAGMTGTTTLLVYRSETPDGLPSSASTDQFIDDELVYHDTNVDDAKSYTYWFASKDSKGQLSPLSQRYTVESLAPSPCTALDAAAFASSGSVKCGHIIWRFTPMEAEGIVRAHPNISSYFGKYERAYLAQADFSGIEPAERSLIIQRSNVGTHNEPGSPLITLNNEIFIGEFIAAGDAYSTWLLRSMGEFFLPGPILQQDQPLPNMKVTTRKTSLASLYHIGRYGSSLYSMSPYDSFTKKEWSDFASAWSNIFGVLPLMGDGAGGGISLPFYSGKYCAKVEYHSTCSSTFTTFSEWSEAEWIGYVSDARRLLDGRGEGVPRLTGYEYFLAPLPDIYTALNREGRPNDFREGMRKTFRFYHQELTPRYSPFPSDAPLDGGSWNSDDIRAQIFVMTMSYFMKKDLTPIFHSYGWPIARITREAILSLQADNFPSDLFKQKLQTFLDPANRMKYFSGFEGTGLDMKDIPQNVSITHSDDKTVFKWTDGRFAAPLKIYRYESLHAPQGTLVATVPIGRSTGDQQRFSISEKNLNYYYELGYEVPKKESVTLFSAITPRIKPSDGNDLTPRGVSVEDTGTGNSIRLSWDRPSREDYAGTMIVRSDSPNEDPPLMMGYPFVTVDARGPLFVYDNTLNPANRRFYYLYHRYSSGGSTLVSDPYIYQVNISAIPTLGPTVSNFSWDPSMLTMKVGVGVPEYYTSAVEVWVYRSPDAVRWTSYARIPAIIDGSDWDHILTGLPVSRSTTIPTYYSFRIVNNKGIESINQNYYKATRNSQSNLVVEELGK